MAILKGLFHQRMRRAISVSKCHNKEQTIFSINSYISSDM